MPLSSLSALRDTDPRPTPELRALVQAHLAATRTASAASPWVDLEGAEQVAAACLALLDATDDLSPEHRSWVQAACLYFAESDDGEADFDSIVGFDDDAEIVNHVCDRVGRTDLRIEMD